jgi:hypothetical protein
VIRSGGTSGTTPVCALAMSLTKSIGSRSVRVSDYQRALRALGKRAVVLGVNRQGVTAFLVVEPDYF